MANSDTVESSPSGPDYPTAPPPQSTFSQKDRPIAVKTPLPEDTLLLEEVIGAEALSELFEYRLTMFAVEDKDVSFSKVLGQPMTVEYRRDDSVTRHVNGIVISFSQGERVVAEGGGTEFIRYEAAVVPKVWLLTQIVQSRIFQQKSVPDILRAVFQGYTVDYRIQGTYEPRDYCVQYRESDFAFACRLMEEEGIFYFFTHADGEHTMVIADSPDGHPILEGGGEVTFAAGGSGAVEGKSVLEWKKSQEIRPGKVTLWDYTFEMPDKEDHLQAIETTNGTISAGKVSHSLAAGGGGSLEVYEHPGGYARRFDGIAPGGGDRAADLNKIFKDGPRTAKVRLRSQAWQGVVVEGLSDVPRFNSGNKFTLQEHPDADGDYVLVRVEHAASIAGSYTAGEGDSLAYRNRFTAIPAAVPFGPLRVTPKPRIDGIQTAVVVGPQNEEIFTDKYGRVKVQFHWDRQGKNNADSSCWIRVATPWAGVQWGAIHIPRIKQEVIVGFEDGDPDQPLILGSVYNATHMPPYTLPDNKTQSGVKSRSSMKGEAENFNELRFEDKKGEELVYFHAEKDFARVVENNDDEKVGFEKKTDGNQTIQIFNNQDLFVGAGKTDAKDGSQKEQVFNTQTILVGVGKADAKDGSQNIDVFNNQVTVVGSGKGSAKDGSLTLNVYKDRTTTIETGNEKLTVSKGDRLVEVTTGNDTHKVDTGNRLVEIATGNDTHTIKTGNRSVEIDLGNDSLNIKTGNQTTKLLVGASSTEAMQSIELKVGGSSLKLDPSGITMKGMVINIEGQIMVGVKGVIVQVNGDAMLILKGGLTMVN